MRNNDEHWLVRPSTVKGLWIAFIAVLAGCVLVQAVVDVKAAFGFDGWFGFGAVFGFGSCVLLVLVAKGLGVVLKRPEGYYDGEGDHDA